MNTHPEFHYSQEELYGIKDEAGFIQNNNNESAKLVSEEKIQIMNSYSEGSIGITNK